jgi:hypothetical protein
MAHRLKVILAGDFWKGRTFPQIRLQGKWLEKAGMVPESHVEVENPAPGVLVIRQIPAGEMPCVTPLI